MLYDPAWHADNPIVCRLLLALGPWRVGNLTTQIEWIARNCKSGPDGRTFGHALDCALSVM